MEPHIQTMRLGRGCPRDRRKDTGLQLGKVGIGAKSSTHFIEFGKHSVVASLLESGGASCGLYCASWSLIGRCWTPFEGGVKEGAVDWV